jgi:hypothetical protein
MAEVEITVESALAELQQMFPDRQVSVDVSFPEYSTKKRYYIQVGVNGHDFHAATLIKCMAQVRAWKDSQ